MISLDNKKISLCIIHNAPINYFCIGQTCAFKRLCCQQCRKQIHHNHQCRTIQSLNNITKDLNQASGSYKMPIYDNSKYQTLIFSIVNSFSQQCSNFSKMIHSSQMSIPLKIVPPFSYMNFTFQQTLGNQLTNLMKFGNNQVQFQHVASILRMIEDSKAENIQQIQEIVQSVSLKLSSAITNWKNKIQNAFTELYFQIQQCDVKNWLHIKKVKSQVNSKIKQPFDNNKKYAQKLFTVSKQIAEETATAHQKSNKLFRESKQIINQFKQGETALIDPQLQKLIDNMFTEVFSHRNLALNNSSQQHRLQSQFKSEQKANIKNQIRHSNILIKTQQCQEYSKNSINKPLEQQNYQKFVLENKGPQNKISKAQIMSTISKLLIDRNFATNLKQFIIQDENQFDLECLQKLASCFPQLTKFNYIWNFEECGLKLEQEQVFFIRSRTLAKELPMSQALLDIYARFKDLQNILISSTNMFWNQQLRIKNQNIKHVTLGSYQQQYQDKQIPAYLKIFTSECKGLITLNLFNFKKLDSTFIANVFQSNFNTLKNIWFSQFIEFSDVLLLQAIKNSKLESIIWDQIKNITHTLTVPQTLKTLIVENCTFTSKIALDGLSRAYNLQNFSIFDSTFTEDNNIGDRSIEQLASMKSQCRISFMNVGQCKSVTCRSLLNLQKMPRIKQLCIDNTNICLYDLSRFQVFLSKLRKLGIVGLCIKSIGSAQQGRPKDEKSTLLWVMQKILTHSTKLRILSLQFYKDLGNIDGKLFQNLKHITIHLSKLNKNELKSQSIKQFLRTIQSLKISFRIV